MNKTNKECKYTTETPNGDWCQALQKPCSPIFEDIKKCEDTAGETFMKRFAGLEDIIEGKE